MIIDDDFKTLRRYTRREAATLLRIPEAWLKEWVTSRVVQHQRSGKPGPRQRGVWFTYDDIVAIGRMLPELMTTRQANGRAEASSQTGPEAAQRADTTPAAVSVAPVAPGPGRSEPAEATPDAASSTDVGVALSAEQLARFRSLRLA